MHLSRSQRLPLPQSFSKILTDQPFLETVSLFLIHPHDQEERIINVNVTPKHPKLPEESEGHASSCKPTRCCYYKSERGRIMNIQKHLLKESQIFALFMYIHKDTPIYTLHMCTYVMINTYKHTDIHAHTET